MRRRYRVMVTRGDTGIRSRPSGRLDRRAVALLLVLAGLFMTGRAAAIDYSVDVLTRGVLRGSFVEEELAGDVEQLELTAGALLRARHRVLFETADFTAHQRISIDGDGRTYHSVPYAYLDAFPLAPVSARIGRHRVSWGTAYGYSPTDVFHPGPETALPATTEAVPLPAATADPARVDAGLGDFGVMEQGATGATLFFVPSRRFSVSAGVAVDDALRHGGELPLEKGVRTGVRVATRPGRFEVIGLGVYQHQRFARAGIAASAPVPGIDAVVVGEIAAEFDSPYLYPDTDATLPTFERDDGVRFLGSFGAQWGASGRLFDLDITGEYLYAGIGYAADEAEAVREWAWELIETAGAESGEPGFGGGFGSILLADEEAVTIDSDREPHIPPFFAQHYVHGEVRADIAGYVEVTTGALVNLVDPSALVEHRVTVIAFDDWDLFLGGRWAAYRNVREAELISVGPSGPVGNPRLGQLPLRPARPARAQIDLGVEVRF